MLLHFGVRPYLVFDGAYLPSKEHTENERAARRKESKKLGLELLAMGRAPQAYLELQKAIDVTPSMARELIEELKRMDVPYVVAPYEADSQLAYLEKHGHISGVVSEDSDLLVFGVRCLLTKLDQYGECVMVRRDDFTACREISLVGWTDKEFRTMTMLSGCDYLPGIDKMGLKTAYRLVRKHKAVERIVRAVQFDGKMKIPPGYLEAFSNAERTFLYQWVFCPEARCLVNLTKLPSELSSDDMGFLGQSCEPHVAEGVAVGDLDPNSKEKLVFNHIPRDHPTSRTTRMVQTPDEKHGKPISEFFKPKRTPLAELDPNSFTPSPSQQALLQSQQGLSWSASQVQPARQPATQRTFTAPQPNRRAVGDPGREPPKRQRLCSDSGLSAAMGGLANKSSATSRFFTRPGPDPSPSLRKPSAQSRKADNFDLWSDDPAAEAVAEMMSTQEAEATEATPSPKKRKKIPVFSDALAEGQDSTTTTTTGKQNEASITPLADVAAKAPSTKNEGDNARLEQSVFTKGIDANFASFKAKYGFHASSPGKTTPSRTHSKTPLQTVEHNIPSLAGALDQNDNDDTKAITIPNSSPPPLPRQHPTTAETHDDNDGTFITDAEWREIEKSEVDPAPASSMLAVQGSEDFLIPNSPESARSGSAGEGEDGERVRPLLNLGRFAFAGGY